MDTTHLHLLLNHVPTIGFIVALAFYVVSILTFSAAVTFAVVKISPAKSAKRQPDKA